LGGILGVPTIYYGASNGAGLDGEGRITQVTPSSGTPNPVTGVTYSTTSTTNPLGALTGVTFGSADSDSFTYDPNTGRMGSYTFSVNGQTDVGSLTWNTNGTLQKMVIDDQIPGTSDSQTCNYLNDDLQRLSTSNCGVLWTQNFTYDAFGNIQKNVPNGDGGLTFLPTYSTTNPNNQFQSLPGITPKYDPDGNLLTDNLNTYTWDPNSGNPASINSTALVYDGLGQMVEQQNGSTYTEILYNPMGKAALMSGQTLTKAFVYLPGGATAIYNSSGLAYLRHSDWLGSSRLTSTAARGMYSSSAYAPFGEQYATSGTSDASFTGQNADTTSTLYDFTFREHSPSQGRWISPDPAGVAVADITNPQSWNRYAYVLGSPLNMIDPSGLDPCWDGSQTAPGVPCFTTVYGGGDPGSGGGGGGHYAPLLDQLGGAGPAISAGTGTPWYKNPCIQKALAKGAATAGLDAIGLLPEGGAVSAAFSLFHGAAGVSNGTNILGRVALGGMLISTASSLSDASGPSGGASSFAAFQTGVNALGIAKSLFEVIPVAGQVIAGVSVVGDFVSTGLEIADCH
jgi:RHS repeat-associated protein